ncbi:MAG: tetratricopeptide repeat protein [Bryobacteraceae bacterium]
MLSFSRFIGGMVILSAAMAQTPAPSGTQHPSNAPALDNRDSPSEAGKNGPALHSVGVKGTIDSGGYSASAVAKSQSALIGDMLKLQYRVLGRLYHLNDLSCSQEGQILNSLKQRPDDYGANLAAGEFYFEHGASAKSLSYLEKARNLNPRDASALMLMGLAEEALGRFDSAEEQFSLASTFKPSEQNFFAWGTALVITGHSDRAVEAFREAVTLHPQSVPLTIGLGAATYGEGNSSDALKILLHAAEMDPSNGASYIFMARIFGNAGTETTEAQVEEMKRLVHMAPDNAEANYAYACSLRSMQLGEPNGPQSREAEELLKRSITLKPTFADAHFELATLYAERGEYEGAIAEYREAIEANPDLVEAHYRLGQAYLRAGQRDQAERELDVHRRLRQAQSQGLPAANRDSASRCPAP